MFRLSARTQLNISGKTDTGKKRKNNEDTFIIDPQLGLMIVADGMGGHASGEVASQLASKLCREQLKRALKTGHVPVFRHVPKNPKLDPRSMILGDCVKFSNYAVFEAAQTNQANHNMGTTLVAALWLDGKLAVAHVGDSRLYIIRNGELTQFTVDHSLVQEQLDKGLIKPEDAQNSDFKNVLTRSIGNTDDVEVDLKEVELKANDFILICSDGLTKMLSDDKIAESFGKNSDPDTIVNELISKANEAGGCDNVTAVVAKVEGVSLTNRVKGIFKKIAGNYGKNLSDV